MVKIPPAEQEAWMGSIPGLGNPLQYSCLENSMDRKAWWVTGHGVAESDTTEQLNREKQTPKAQDRALKGFRT